MTRTYLILKTTDTLHRAIDGKSLNDAHQALVALRDDIQEYEVDDDAYDEVLEGVETLLEVLQSRKKASMDGLPDDVASQLGDLTHQIESLYLRHSDNDTDNGESIERLREERDLYREKLREYDRELRELKDFIHEKQLEMTEQRAKAEQKAEDMQDEAEDRRQSIRESTEAILGTDAVEQLDEGKSIDDINMFGPEDEEN